MISKAIGGIAALLVSPGLPRAAGVEDFYKGRNVTLIIGYSVGGGYDAYARLLARYIGKHIPGDPSIIPQQMTGAGSLRAANFIYSVAAKDGSVFGTFSRSMGISPLVDKADVRQPQIHLARQRHRRQDDLRHLEHVADQELE